MCGAFDVVMLKSMTEQLNLRTQLTDKDKLIEDLKQIITNQKANRICSKG
jgi:hypothetical protein